MSQPNPYGPQGSVHSPYSPSPPNASHPHMTQQGTFAVDSLPQGPRPQSMSAVYVANPSAQFFDPCPSDVTGAEWTYSFWRGNCCCCCILCELQGLCCCCSPCKTINPAIIRMNQLQPFCCWACILCCVDGCCGPCWTSIYYTRAIRRRYGIRGGWMEDLSDWCCGSGRAVVEMSIKEPQLGACSSCEETCDCGCCTRTPSPYVHPMG